MTEPPAARLPSVTRAGWVRQSLSTGLVVLASVALLAGGVTLYAREEIFKPSAFADRALDAVHEPVLQRVVSREIAVQILEPSVPDLVAVRPVVSSGVRLLITSGVLAPILRLAAENGERVLFERGGGNAVFQIADAGTVVSSALRTLAPDVARDLLPRAEAVLLTLRRRSFATESLRVADRVRLLGIVLPALALFLFVLAVVLAPRRRQAVTRSAVAVGLTGIAFVIVFELTRRYVLSHLYGSGYLTNSDIRGAAGELWGAYLDDLLTWALACTAAAWLVAAASGSLLAPYAGGAGLRHLIALARRPLGARARIIRGALVLGLGGFLIVEPSLALRIAGVLGGCLLVYLGVGELLSATTPAEPRARRLGAPRRRRAITIGILGAATVAAIVLGVELTGASPNIARAGDARAAAVMTCNGYAQLCGRRLNQVVFAGTHNSMSAADSPGWLIANQDRAISQQLDDGIRLFKISTHYGTADSAGWVHTDVAAEGTKLNRVADKLDPAARAALQRLSESLTPGSLTGRRREVWLCHTLCELGATRMVDFLGTIRRFLELNPHQVIVLFDEDYVSERDLQSAFRSSGLLPYLASLQRGRPLPTLAELIRSRHNVVVFAQEPTSGKYAWDPYAFNWIQDTPLGAVRPGQFSCKLYRGRPGNPLLMMNDWADVFPPRVTPNVPLVKRAFILARARQCIRQRGRIPNLILTDYYDRGDVVGAVAELNGVAKQRPSPIDPVSGGK